MDMIDLRFRQIHLDFHTSEAIPGIGAEFDPEEFAATLERAHVNSITCFARCHHGWVLHLLHYIPERRGQDFDVLEDVIPLFNTQLSVQVPRKITRVISVPDDYVLDHTLVDRRVAVTLPRLEGHHYRAPVRLSVTKQRRGA